MAIDLVLAPVSEHERGLQDRLLLLSGPGTRSRRTPALTVRNPPYYPVVIWKANGLHLHVIY